MKKLGLLILLITLCGAASAQSNPPLQLREVDGVPSKTNATQLVFPNGTLSISGGVVTVTISGSGTVTNTGILTNGNFIRGNGGGDVGDSGVAVSNVPLLDAANVFTTTNQFPSIGIASGEGSARRLVNISAAGIDMGALGGDAFGFHVDLSGGGGTAGEHLIGLDVAAIASIAMPNTGSPIGVNVRTTVNAGIVSDQQQNFSGSAQVSGTANSVWGTYDQVATVGLGTISLNAVAAFHDIVSAGGAINNPTLFEGRIRKLGAGTIVGTATGIKLIGWSGAPVTSYGIYADASIDIGTTSYFIKSLSNSPSELSGDFTTFGFLKAGTTPTTLTNAAGKVLINALAVTGTPDGTKFLRDDGSWQAVGGGGSGQPAGVSTELQARLNGTTFQALTGSSINGANLSMVGALTTQRDNIGATLTEGIALKNTTDASAPTPTQQSPSIGFYGSVWDSDREEVHRYDLRMTWVPTFAPGQNTAGSLRLQFSDNGGTFSTIPPYDFASDGTFTLGHALEINPAGAGGGGFATTVVNPGTVVLRNTDGSFQSNFSSAGFVAVTSNIDVGSVNQAIRDVYIHGAGVFTSASLKLTGTPTGHRVVTFPDASIMVARTDAAQTFTGDQTISGLLKAGTGPTTLTDSVGKILSASLNTVGFAQGGTGLSALGSALQQIRVNAGATALEYFTPSAGGAQTPWTSLIDGDGFNLEDVGSLIPRAGSILGSAALPWLSTFTGSTTQYESVVQSAGVITHAALGSATDIGITFNVRGNSLPTSVLTLSAVASGTPLTGLNIKSNASGAGVTLAALGGTNETIFINGKGSASPAVVIGLLPSNSQNISLDPRNSSTGTAVIDSNTGEIRFAVPLKVLTSVSLGSTALGASDVGVFRSAAGIIAITNAASGQWGSLLVGTRDASTNVVSNGLTIGHQSTGTPAAGLGSGVLFNINSSTTPDRNAGQYAVLWTDATDATRSADHVFYNVLSGAALAETFRIKANGTAVHNGPSRLKGYTVATLPAGIVGDTAYVTDLLTPTFFALAVGGGSTIGPVFFNGTNWVTY